MKEGIETSRRRAELAVMSIFRDLSKGTGEPLSMDQIVVAWADYGLRATDLPRALDGLLRSRLLSPHDGPTPDALALTSTGTDWLDLQPAWLRAQLMARRERARFLRAQAPGRVRVSGRRRRFDTGTVRT